MTRADQLLVQQGLAPTRSAAQRLIATGAVRWMSPRGWAVPHKAGEDLPARGDEVLIAALEPDSEDSLEFSGAEPLEAHGARITVTAPTTGTG